jgi:hypothetical protein
MNLNSIIFENSSYDNNGNLTDDGLFKYYYDCENRLTYVNDQNDTAVASYSYDYLGRRKTKDSHLFKEAKTVALNA